MHFQNHPLAGPKDPDLLPEKPPPPPPPPPGALAMSPIVINVPRRIGEHAADKIRREMASLMGTSLAGVKLA